MWNSWVSKGKRLEQPSQHSVGFTESTQLPKPLWTEPSVSASAPFRYAFEHCNRLIGWHFVSVAASKISAGSYSPSTEGAEHRGKFMRTEGCEGRTPTITPTQHSDVCVGFLRRIRVELAHIASLVGEWHIGQRHTQFVLGEIDQLEPAVLQSCGGYTWDRDSEDAEDGDTSVRQREREKNSATEEKMRQGWEMRVCCPLIE